MRRIVVTGGAGFIGSHLVKRLVRDGAIVTVLDNLSEQIHGARADFADDLVESAICVRGDVRDRALFARVLKGQDVVVHLAAETGTGQSMYAIAQYTSVNVQGVATLLDILVNDSTRTVSKIILASSRAIYGEGAYSCSIHGLVFPGGRRAQDMTAGSFEPTCPACGSVVDVHPTGESSKIAPMSFYGISKAAQEQMVLLLGATLGLDAFALRYQNVYGPGQSLANPYTGLLGVFANLARRGESLNVFEDGAESRDFVHVQDVVEATALCAQPGVRGIHALNVGSGERTTILNVAETVVSHFASSAEIRISGDFRVGDIRHNVADISQIKRLLGFSPRSFQNGINNYLSWVGGQAAVDSGFHRSMDELREHGLLGKQL